MKIMLRYYYDGPLGGTNGIREIIGPILRCRSEKELDLEWKNDGERYFLIFIKVGDDVRKSLGFLARITEILGRNEQTVILNRHKIVFEEGDSLEDASKVMQSLFELKDFQELRIKSAIRKLKETRNAIASKKLGEIRKDLEYCLSLYH